MAQLRNSINDMKQIARSAGVIVDRNNVLEDGIESNKLKLQLLFTE